MTVYGGDEDYFAKKFVPECDYLDTLNYQVYGASLLLIDFDPPDSGQFADDYDLYLWQGTDPPGSMPPSGPNLLYSTTFNPPYCTAPPGWGCIYIWPVEFEPPVLVTSATPLWLIMHFDYDAFGYGPALGSDAAPNFDYEFYEPYGGVHRVFEDSYWWNPYNSTWFRVDEVDMGPDLYQWNNLCMDLMVHDCTDDGVDNIFRDDLINMALVPVQPNDSDSLVPIEGMYVGDSLGVQFLITNNSANPDGGDSVCCLGVEVVIEDPAADTAYDVLWLYDLHEEELCMPNGGGHGISSTLYPLYTVDDTGGLGPPFVFEGIGEYTIQTVVWQWDCDTLIWHDQSQCHDTLKDFVLVFYDWPPYYEPNEDPTSAFEIVCGDTLPESGLTLSIPFTTDIDWFTFTIAETMMVQIDIDATTMEPPSPLNATMSLWQDPGPTLITVVDDDPRAERDPYLRRRLPPGTYYLWVMSEDGSIGPYRLETCCDIQRFCDVSDSLVVAWVDTGMVFIADMATEKGSGEGWRPPVRLCGRRGLPRWLGSLSTIYGPTSVPWPTFGRWPGIRMAAMLVVWPTTTGRATCGPATGPTRRCSGSTSPTPKLF